MSEVKGMDMISEIQSGDKRAAARLISMLENHDPEALKLLHSCAVLPVKAKVIGITGAPGAGKSTLTDQLAKFLLMDGKKVGIIAVDPSSPISGGAFLGDRIRMSDLNSKKEVFIRSMATRGALGGISKAVSGAVRVMEIYGAEYIFIETVGIGQSEIDVASQADTVVLVVVPGMGDDIQAEKAGILEVSDIIAVNKADHEDTDRTIKQLKAMLGLRMGVHPQNIDGEQSETGIIPTIATTGEGINELMNAIEVNLKQYAGTGSTREHVGNRFNQEFKRMVLEKLESEITKFETETQALTTSSAKILNQQTDITSEIQSLIDEYIKWRRTKC
jgi:LAO/AO transport system kinase